MNAKRPVVKPAKNHPWKRKALDDKPPRRIDSRAKGAAGEREFSGLLLERLGVKLVRNLEQSRSGGHDLEPVGDDPTAQALRRFAIESKRYATITPALLAQFWQQAESQARGASRLPALAYRANRHEWRVLVPLSAINGDAFGAWSGVEWTASVSVEAFCALVRDMAGSGKPLADTSEHSGNMAP